MIIYNRKQNQSSCSSNPISTKDDWGKPSSWPDQTFGEHLKAEDWGCTVDRILIRIDKNTPLASMQLSPERIQVTEQKQGSLMNSQSEALLSASRKVIQTYYCDEYGKRSDRPTSFIMLELAVDPASPSPFLYSEELGCNIWPDPYELEIIFLPEQTNLTENSFQEALKIKGSPQCIISEADEFSPQTFTAKDGTEMTYALWHPETQKDTKTLFIWLHGLGEGGSKITRRTDWKIPLLASKVTAHIQNDFQECLKGAHILVPQCPTYWMDPTGDQPDFWSIVNKSDGTSYWTSTLIELIDEVKAKNGYDKLVIAGSSNGGFMTMILALHYQDQVSAYVPICEAMPDAALSDEQIKILSNLPMFFIWAESDDTINPELHEVPTLKRMSNIADQPIAHFTTEYVEDTSGRFFSQEGKPHKYGSHWSWISFHNNTARYQDMPVWEWIAKQLDTKSKNR